MFFRPLSNEERLKGLDFRMERDRQKSSNVLRSTAKTKKNNLISTSVLNKAGNNELKFPVGK